MILSLFLIDDPAEVQRLLAQRATNSDRIFELLRAIEPRLDTAEEKRLFAGIEAARKPYMESYQQALAKLVNDHQPGEARKIMVEITLPQIAEYHAAWNAFSKCQEDAIEQGISQSKVDFASAQRRLLLMIAVAVLITSGMAVYVTRRVTREMARRDQAENALRQSHDQLEQRVQQRTTELEKTNQALQAEIAERKQAGMEIQHQATFARFNPNPVLELSASGEINYFNHAAGVMARELGRETPAQMLPPNTAAMVRECLASGTPKLRVETQIGARVISWSFFPVKFNNTVHCYAGDITERRQSEEALRRSETKFRTLYDSTGDAVMLLDEKGFFDCNPAALAMLGCATPGGVLLETPGRCVAADAAGRHGFPDAGQPANRHGAGKGQPPIRVDA